MKRIIMTLTAGIIAAMLFTGCGEDKKASKIEHDDGIEEIHVNEIQIEEIRVETILVEETLVEETLIEKTYIDGEYKNELDYNSQTNGWENNVNIKYW